MQETAGVGHHLPGLTRLEHFDHLGRLFAEEIVQRPEHGRGFGDVQQLLGAVVQADDPTLVVNDDNRILHCLEYGLVCDRREFDDLLGEHQPSVDRQHDRECYGYIGNRIGTQAEVVGQRGGQRSQAGRHEQEQAATMGARDSAAVNQ